MPSLDTVAAEGVRFDVAISPAPLTLPSHASLMTALDPPAHGVRHDAIHRLADGIPALAEHLRAAGDATAAVVGSLVVDSCFGLTRGFDVYDDVMAGRVSAKVGFASAFASHPYAGEIAFTDAQFGRLVGELRKRWPEERTLRVVTSDRGESLGEHGEATHAYSIYDATRSPVSVPSMSGRRSCPATSRTGSAPAMRAAIAVATGSADPRGPQGFRAAERVFHLTKKVFSSPRGKPIPNALRGEERSSNSSSYVFGPRHQPLASTLHLSLSDRDRAPLGRGVSSGFSSGLANVRRAGRRHTI